ncbi:hypothetical protein CWE04_08965 [Thomasclavelia cocleata]|nr:hypothetical protein CWE04_08965 [Thomasclavelia cocleata]
MINGKGGILVKRFIKKILTVLIVITICISNGYFLTDILAKEEAAKLDDYKDKTKAGATLDADQEITIIDENGNIYPMEKTSIKNARQALDVQPKINSSSIAVVNFKTQSSASYNTEYTEFNTGRSGYTNGYYAADGAFLGYDNESNPKKVKFMQAGIVGWVDVNKVQVLEYTSSTVNTLSKYYVKNGRIYHGISTDLGSSKYSSSLDYGPKPSYLKEGVDYYSYDGHYFYEGSTYSSYAKMLNDYRNNTRTNSVNSSSPYYNYYEYLSHRSITVYSSDQLNKAIASMVEASENSYKRTSKLRDTAETFIENQDKYGTNALLMIAVAANESAWGCSRIAEEKNNLFGHSAYDSDPSGSANGYSSVEYSIYYHSSQFISKGYLDPVTDGRYFGANLGDKGSGINVKYASDPYWGEKAAAICWKIDSYLGSKDSYKYTIGIKDTINTNHSVVNIKSDAVSSSSTLYSTYPKSKTTALKDHAPANYAFIILKNGEKNNYYKIQSDGAVNSNRTGIINTPSQAEYSFDKDYGYIQKSSVEVVSNGSDSSSSITQNSENVTGQPTGKDSNEPTILYSANSQNIGWLEQVTEPNTAGTTGRSLDLYQIKISLKNVAKSVKLSGKVYSDGKWLTYNEIITTTEIGNGNKALQIVNFNLSNQAGYRLQYRVHSADIGWQAWVNQGENAGVSGKNIQAIDFKLIRDNSVVIPNPSINYQAHVADYGWLEEVSDGKKAGTTGKNKQMEAIKISLTNNAYNGTVEYSVHVQDYGWMAWTDNGKLAGTTGKNKQIEAIKIRLTDELENEYDIYYRVHAENLGWLDWASNGKAAGSAGYSYQIEAIEIKLVRKRSSAPGATVKPYVQKKNIKTSAHVADYGWLSSVYDGSIAGTIGKCKQMEAIKISLENPAYEGDIEYRVHSADIGWQSWTGNGETAGVTGRNKQMEAIEIRFTGEMEKEYDIYYRAHIADYGWLDWTANGKSAGSEGLSKRIEAIEIRVVQKGGNAPGATGRPFIKK